MQRFTRLALALVGIIGLHGTARAAAYDFSFLLKGSSVGQGTFGIPDADLGRAYVDSSEFTSFSFTTSGKTFSLPDLTLGGFMPNTTSFAFAQGTASGVGYIFNAYLLLKPTPGFVVTGGVYSPCYFMGLCGPEYPSVFTGGNIQLGDFAGVTSSVHYDTILVVPAATTVPEPAAAALLGPAILGVTMLARRRPTPA